jgi:hypothetical protein
VLTARAAAALIAAADSINALIRLGKEIGFAGPATTLDATAREAIGVPSDAIDAAIIAGAGSLRALVMSVPAPLDARSVLRRTASRLAARAPHVLWIIVVGESGGDGLALGAPSLERRPPRVAALVTSRARVVDSDAQTIRLLAGAMSSDDLATHARCIDILGRDAVSRRFFRTLEGCVSDLAASSNTGTHEERSEIALLYTCRLLFLGFLEAKGWLNEEPGFVSRLFDATMASGGSFHGRVLRPLFFGTLNTPVHRRAPRARAFGQVPFLNGGLFTPTPQERRLARLRFDDAAFGAFFGALLDRYRFTAREETMSLEEAAIDPEMLGRAFECLMSTGSRKSTGAFYTPHELVVRVIDAGLSDTLAASLGDSVASAILKGDPISREAQRLALEAIRGLRVLDPACGSGAFLVHVLERIALLRMSCGDTGSAQAVRRDVLSRSIFGVDVNPMAVWLCQLRLWLSIVIDCGDSGDSIRPLPNLDRNVRTGDSLAGAGFHAEPLPGGPALRRLRERYSRATGARKGALSRALDREERRLLLREVEVELESVRTARHELVLLRRGRDLFGGRVGATREQESAAAHLRARSAALRTLRRQVRDGAALPFSFAAHFADVADAGGFSLVVGNPPWVRPHNVDPRARERLKARFVVARSGAWLVGAQSAGAGRGFASQVDLSALFVERAIRLLTPRGVFSFLLPTKLWRSLSGGGMRRLVLDETRVTRIEDYADTPAAFDAAVYPGLLVARRASHGEAAGSVRVATLHRGRTATTWIGHTASIALDASAGAPWLVVPPRVREAFDVLRDAGVPLSESPLGRPSLGVKCGVNDAFLVGSLETRGEEISIVSTNGRQGIVEAQHLRPLVRGEELRPWRLVDRRSSIIWPYDKDASPLRTLPPGLHRWLAPYRSALKARADSRDSRRWWELFRIDGARSDQPRVVWADIGRSPRAVVLAAGDATVPLNTCYSLRCSHPDDAWAVAALLNSALGTAWLSLLAEPARGGYRRYLGWTMCLLPIPHRWDAHREKLACVGRACADGLSDDLEGAVLNAFGVSWRSVEPLLTWTAP